jgi:hypothetical protein
MKIVRGRERTLLTTKRLVPGHWPHLKRRATSDLSPRRDNSVEKVGVTDARI